MATKICLSEKEFTEKVGKQCENEFKRLTETLFKNITDKYEEMVKEQTKSEIDKVNEAILQQCPEHGALVLVIDKNEIHVPINPLSKVSISGYARGSIDKTLDLTWEQLTEENLQDVVDFIYSYEGVKIQTSSARDVEMYDKEAFDNENKVVKYTKHYYNNYTSYVDCSDIKCIYLVNTKLD